MGHVDVSGNPAAWEGLLEHKFQTDMGLSTHDTLKCIRQMCLNLISGQFFKESLSLV